MDRYRPKYPIRIVTAASLFDGHDAAINIMRRILQGSGAEVIHLGHNRSAAEIVECAIHEDAQAIAVTSYQGGHLEFFSYMHQLLEERGANIKIFAGGGGTILPEEIEALHAAGIARVYSPDDGRSMGLQGMIDDLLKTADFPTRPPTLDGHPARLDQHDPSTIAGLITVAENYPELRDDLARQLEPLVASRTTPVLGITGTGGAGKSSVVDELIRRFLGDFPEKTVAILSVDPSKRKSGGALLGDRIRMNSIFTPRVYMRSLATRGENLSLSRQVTEAIAIVKAAGFDFVIVETSGIGQSDTQIVDHADVSLYVMTADYGAATQLEKIDMLDFADVVAINKFDKPGSLDALRDVRKQYRRNHGGTDLPEADIPILGTIASQFNDPGMNDLYRLVMEVLACKTGAPFGGEVSAHERLTAERVAIIPAARSRYLAEIAESLDAEQTWIRQQAEIARQLYQLHGAVRALRKEVGRDEALVPQFERQQDNPPSVDALIGEYEAFRARLDPRSVNLLEAWPAMRASYREEVYRYTVRDRVIERELFTESLSHLRIPKIALPRYHDWGDLLTWLLEENVPGEFPFTGGVFHLKREAEDPGRQFAGEGGPERTNRRFHYVSRGVPAKRLSTAFDSVTLYGEDPDRRPDIYGKVGNSGVSVATLDDAKKLYSGFNLCDPATSVSMTINGPAPMVLGFFLNTAIDQQCEIYIRQHGMLEEVQERLDAIDRDRGTPRPTYQGELPPDHDELGLLLLGTTGDQVLTQEAYSQIRADTLATVRGTVQADILKEDQAQNTCIFSTEFALRMMGDIQQYFVDHRVRNFYSVSISGYHIAEAGANPISQLAFTLANGFTFVEYYLSRGMAVDDFAPNLSFFFSNGLDPEYTVIGRVARRIWARAMRHRYGANERAQKLKYHIQTSGRSLHAQEIGFNDIRTTLQALYAIYDNCNSLHTNAYDEAITTPTEESVRRAMAIQLIINRELGLARNENPLQGAFIVEELTDLVEQAVLHEFRALSDRGGVLGAMERMYQRGKIQDESLYYERLKHSGALPVVGVNTFLDPDGSPTIIPQEVIRSTPEERDYAIAALAAFQNRNAALSEPALVALRECALHGENTFTALMETCKVCSLGQITRALYDVGGQYRRNM
jgi:methylmalonyl-CoA mutase